MPAPFWLGIILWLFCTALLAIPARRLLEAWRKTPFYDNSTASKRIVDGLRKALEYERKEGTNVLRLKSISVVCGELHADFWQAKPILRALQKALEQGVTLSIASGPILSAPFNAIQKGYRHPIIALHKKCRGQFRLFCFSSREQKHYRFFERKDSKIEGKLWDWAVDQSHVMGIEARLGSYEKNQYGVPDKNLEPDAKELLEDFERSVPKRAVLIDGDSDYSKFVFLRVTDLRRLQEQLDRSREDVNTLTAADIRERLSKLNIKEIEVGL